MIAFDAIKIENDDKFQFHFGGEYWLFRDIFALRAGYSEDHFTAGASFGWQMNKFNFMLDYAFLNDVLDEGATNQLSLFIQFK